MRLNSHTDDGIAHKAEDYEEYIWLAKGFDVPCFHKAGHAWLNPLGLVGYNSSVRPNDKLQYGN